MKIEVDINANIISWAISRAGYQLQDITTAIPNIQSWLDGTKKPTVKQLEKFSKKVYLPYGYLFLKDPPKEKIPFPFFRTNNASQNKVSINVVDTIRIMQQRQDWLHNYLDDNGFEPLSFIAKYPTGKNVLEIVADIRKILQLPENWASSQPNWSEALDYLTKKIEAIGVIVVFNGVVENNTSKKSIW